MSYSEGASTADHEGVGFEGISSAPAEPVSDGDRARWSALEALPSPVAVIDARNIVRWVNAAWTRSLAERNDRGGEVVGTSVTQVCGRGMGYGAEGLDATRDGLRAVLVGAKKFVEFELACHPRGGEAWFSVSLAPCALDGGRGALLQMVETTEVRQAERRRSVARAVARALGRDDARHEMLHDVINEVCSIMGWSLAARWVWDRAAKSLRCESVFSQRPDGSRGWGALRNEQGLAARVWHSRAPQWSEGLDREDAAVARTVLNDRSSELREAVGIPVGRDGHPDGVVVFYSAHGHRPDAAFLHDLSTLLLGGAWAPVTVSRGHVELRPSRRPSPRGVMTEVIELAASSRCSALVTGERGVGKAHAAREIHASSDRSRGPFIECDCATLPSRDFELVMFGCEGSTSPQGERARRGLLEQAAGGTLLLRNVGGLDAASQSKLLKLLDTRSFTRVGGTRAQTPDARILATSPYDLRGAAYRKSFSEDLLQRLSGLVIALPPLRERGAELGDIARSALADLGREYGSPAPTLTPEAEARLVAHAWPGNVRELRTVLERAWLGLGDCVTADAITAALASFEETSPCDIAAPPPPPAPRRAAPVAAPVVAPPVVAPPVVAPPVVAPPVVAPPVAEPVAVAPPVVERPQRVQPDPSVLLGALEPTALTLAEVERAHIERVLVQMGFNMRRAATALDISRSTLYLRAKHYRIHVGNARRVSAPGVENDNDLDGSDESATGT